MKMKKSLNVALMAFAMITSMARAEALSGEKAAPQEPFISLEAPSAADAYLPNILTPVLVTHSESQASYARAVMHGWDSMPALVEGLALPARDGVNFSIELNEWHEPMRIERN